MMTETIAPAESQAAESPRIPRPHKDMPGRQRRIQDCVDQILAKVDSKPAAAGG
jgi:hypothetical protein